MRAPLRRCGVASAQALGHRSRVLATVLDELHLEHRLQHRVVGGADRLLALGPGEAPALQRGDHLVDVAHRALAQSAHDHLPRDEAVGREEVGHLPTLLHRRDEPVVHLVPRPVRDVVREERDLVRDRPERRVRRALVEARDHLVDAREDALLVERPPHRGRRRPGPGDEEEVGLLLLDLLGERREVLRREWHEDPVHLLAAEAAHHLVDGEEVPEPERRVLREDGDVLTAATAEVRACSEDVLVALPAGPERVLVDPCDRIRRRGAGDVQHLVLVGERRQLQRDARRGRAGDDLVPLADQVLRASDGLHGVGAVVHERELDLAAVDCARPLRRVGNSIPQPLDELRAVRGEQPRP